MAWDAWETWGTSICAASSRWLEGGDRWDAPHDVRFGLMHVLSPLMPWQETDLGRLHSRLLRENIWALRLLHGDTERGENLVCIELRRYSYVKSFDRERFQLFELLQILSHWDFPDHFP